MDPTPARLFGQAIDDTRRRLRRASFWQLFTAGTGWGLLAAGVVVLLGKLTAPAVVMAGFITAGAALLAALVAAAIRRRDFPAVQAAILLDRNGKLEGLPLLHSAFPESEWFDRSPESAARAAGAVPRLDPRPFVRRILPGLLFLFAVTLLPQQKNFGAPLPRPNLAALREIQRLTEKIEALEEKKILPEEETDRLRREIEKLEETAKENAFSQESWEGMDHLTEQMKQSVRERAAQFSRAASTAGSLSDSLAAKDVEDSLKSEQAAAVLRALAGLPSLSLPSDLQKLLQDLQKPGGLDAIGAEDLKKGLDDLRDFLERERTALGEGG